jgi:hypothetical protein
MPFTYRVLTRPEHWQYRRRLVVAVMRIIPQQALLTERILCAEGQTSPNLARIVKTIRSTRLSGNHMSPSQHHNWEVGDSIMSCAHGVTCPKRSTVADVRRVCAQVLSRCCRHTEL